MRINWPSHRPSLPSRSPRRAASRADSLSVVVPVHNVERTLPRQINHLLEVLQDLATRFEVMIVDDGSTDQTEDVAYELSVQYPQVRVARHPEQLGLAACAETGAALTTGEIVVVHAGAEVVNAGQLEQMWQDRADEELVVAPVGSKVGGVASEVLRRLEDWGSEVVRQRADAAVPGGLPRQPLGKRSPASPAPPQKPSVVPTPAFRFPGSRRGSSMHQE